MTRKRRKVPKVDLELVRGDTFSDVLYLTAGKPPQKVDITNHQFRGQLKRIDTNDVLASFVFTKLDAYRVKRSIASAVTALLPTDTVRLCRYDCEWTSPDGETRTFVEGTIRLKSDTTNG